MATDAKTFDSLTVATLLISGLSSLVADFPKDKSLQS